MSAGAEIASVPFADVLFTWDPKLINFFLDQGADVITDRPVAAAFGERVSQAFGLGYSDEHQSSMGVG